METQTHRVYLINSERKCSDCIFHYEKFVGYGVGGYQGKCFLREEKGMKCPLEEDWEEAAHKVCLEKTDYEFIGVEDIEVKK